MCREEFSAAKLILDLAKKEYDDEINRTSVIDTKVNIALPIVSTYTFLVFDKIIKRKRFLLLDEISEEIFTFILICVLIGICILGAILSLYNLFRCIKMNNYKVIRAEEFSDYATMNRPEGEVAGVSIDCFIKASQYNREINNCRAKKYQKGWNFAALSFVAYVIYIFV